MRYAIFACLLACGSQSASGPATTPPPAPSGGAAAECVVAGCSGQLCGRPGDDTITTCEMKAEYACYKGAECKVQPSGECGWTMDDKLKSCMASPPPLK